MQLQMKYHTLARVAPWHNISLALRADNDCFHCRLDYLADNEAKYRFIKAAKLVRRTSHAITQNKSEFSPKMSFYGCDSLDVNVFRSFVLPPPLALHNLKFGALHVFFPLGAPSSSCFW